MDARTFAEPARRRAPGSNKEAGDPAPTGFSEPAAELAGLLLCPPARSRPLRRITSPVRRSTASRVKRLEDILLAAIALAAFALPMILIALAVRLDSPGSILFRQRRTGHHDRPFEMLKFRTMREELSDPEGRQQTTRDDLRVTRLGAMLRRSSLDELPQLFNVLRGEMSLVGPRPHAPGTRAAGRLFQDVVPGYAARHRVRPGLTGLAQVRGLRGPTDTEEKILLRVESDLEYIERWSVWLDLLIILRTAIAVLRMKNAF